MTESNEAAIANGGCVSELEAKIIKQVEVRKRVILTFLGDKENI